MKVTASLSLPEALPRNPGSCVVAIDVLRASTTIVTALRNGCLEAIPVATIDDARRVAASRPGALLCGERRGKRIEGFDLGNSPHEYSRQAVDGRTLVLSTTNGTVLLKKYDGFERVVGCFANLRTLVPWLLERSIDRGVHIACAGKLNRPGLEDIACAGAMVSLLDDSLATIECDDAALVALAVWKHFREDSVRAVSLSSHSEYLCSIGQRADIEYCSTIGDGPIPYMPAGADVIRDAEGGVD